MYPPKGQTELWVSILVSLLTQETIQIIRLLSKRFVSGMAFGCAGVYGRRISLAFPNALVPVSGDSHVQKIVSDAWTFVSTIEPDLALPFAINLGFSD